MHQAMKTIGLLCLGVLVATTSAQAADLKLPGAHAADMPPPPPRSCVCTREYKPVCGRTAEGVEKTFANACLARCAGAPVLRPGKC